MTNGLAVEADPQSLVHCAFVVLGEHASTPKLTKAKPHLYGICKVFIEPSTITVALHRRDSYAFGHTTAATFVVFRIDDSGPRLMIEIEASFRPGITWQDPLLAPELLALN